MRNLLHVLGQLREVGELVVARRLAKQGDGVSQRLVSPHHQRTVRHTLLLQHSHRRYVDVKIDVVIFGVDAYEKKTIERGLKRTLFERPLAVLPATKLYFPAFCRRTSKISFKLKALYHFGPLANFLRHLAAQRPPPLHLSKFSISGHFPRSSTLASSAMLLKAVKIGR